MLGDAGEVHLVRAGPVLEERDEIGLVVLGKKLVRILGEVEKLSLAHLTVQQVVLDELDAGLREKVWETLASPEAPWTLLVVTNETSLGRYDQVIHGNK